MSTKRELTDAEVRAAMRRFGWLDGNGNSYGGRRCVQRCDHRGKSCTDQSAICALGPEHGGEHLCAMCDDKRARGET